MVEIRSVRSKIRSCIINVAYYTFKIIGLAPFSIQTKTSADEYHRWSKTVFLYSKTGLAYNIIISILACILAVVSIQSWFIISRGRNYISSAYFLFISILVTRGVGTIVAIGLWTIKQREIVHIANTLSEVDSLLSCLKHQAFNKRMNVSFAISVIVAISCFCNPLILVDLQVDLYSASYLYINSLLIELPRIIIYFFHIQYLFLLGPVIITLERVNKNLSCFMELENFTCLEPPFANYLAVFHSRSNQSFELATLRALRAIRTTISELSQNIADLFSFPILIVITAYFIYILDAIFSVISYYSLAEVDHILPPDIFPVLVQLVQVFQPLISLLDIIAQTKVEARLTASIVNRAIATSIKREITAELEDFSLQLLGEEIEFTAYGLFPLDNKILHSILSATATYLLILWQALQANEVPES